MSSPCCGPNAGGQVAVAVSATQVPLTSPDDMVVQLRTRTQVRAARNRPQTHTEKDRPSTTSSSGDRRVFYLLSPSALLSV